MYSPFTQKYLLSRVFSINCRVQGLLCLGFVVSMVCYVQGLSCLGSVMSRVCHVQGLLCLGFVVSRVCYVQCLLCLGFVMSSVCYVQGLLCLGLVCLGFVMAPSQTVFQILNSIAISKKLYCWREGRGGEKNFAFSFESFS